MFSKKSEQTACGPSGVTMPYYKSFCEDNELAQFYSSFIRLPFKFGFSLDRWKQSIQFMLLKTKVPHWEKLWIMQLLEGDFKGGLRYIFASKLMHHTDVHKTSSNYTFGGRHGKSCHDALLRVQFFYEFHRIMRYPAVGSDINASACYDRQHRNAISLCTCHAGVPKRKQRYAKLRLWKVCGTKSKQRWAHPTKRYFIHQWPQCTDQARVVELAGGTNWHCHKEVIFKTYAQFHPPLTMSGPDTSKEVDQAGVSFVDNNTLLHSFPPTTPTQQMLNKSQEAIGTWQAMMTITGGSLALPKCHNLLLSHNFNTFKYCKGSK